MRAVVLVVETGEGKRVALQVRSADDRYCAELILHGREAKLIAEQLIVSADLAADHRVTLASQLPA